LRQIVVPRRVENNEFVIHFVSQLVGINAAETRSLKINDFPYCLAAKRDYFILLFRFASFSAFVKRKRREWVIERERERKRASEILEDAVAVVVIFLWLFFFPSNLF